MAGTRPPGHDPTWSPRPLPGEVERWRDVLGSLPGHADAVVRTVSRSLRTARNLSSRNRAEAGPPPPAPFEAPRTSINRAISPHRRVALAELSLDDVRRVREVIGGTTNDVVLAVTSGALRSFFAARGEQPETSLVGMVPVSVRTEAEDGTLGNRVSAMLVSLASAISDPVERLRRIGEETRTAKEQNRVVDPGVFAGWAQALVPSVATRLTRLVTNLRLFDHLSPLFNLIVSNVPGPDFPLYLAGARMVAMYPLGPIIEGVGLNVTVFSYLDTLYVGRAGLPGAHPGPRRGGPGDGGVPGRVGQRGPTGSTGRCRGGTQNSLREAGVHPGRTGGPGAGSAGRTTGMWSPAREIRAGQLLGCGPHADVAQLVEHHLAKVRVAGSNPVVRSSVMSRDIGDRCAKTS